MAFLGNHLQDFLDEREKPDGPVLPDILEERAMLELLVDQDQMGFKENVESLVTQLWTDKMVYQDFPDLMAIQESQGYLG